MKSKTKTYTLLGLVLAIWGIVGYRIILTIKPTEPNTSKQNINVAFNPKINTKVDTFSIQPLDRDPFLGILHKKRNPISNTKKAVLKTPILWPSLVYHGVILKQDSKEKVCVLSINEKQHIIKVGQNIENVKLLKANSKEASVIFKGQRKTITKL
ncbi:hypothetical protein Q4Q39_02670 [Flavivirga amylovorans]|uniref:Uncharacterized protein n=1 Tax=Flavivirga amylovorans TaxID=870486 RepID=A0ABT8WX76_9FLAO|nr:hypothetical protein [Flavivirga amylovorans]MDO5986297.1 hypothetical protein [Flavivirga amylovorans]